MLFISSRQTEILSLVLVIILGIIFFFLWGGQVLRKRGSNGTEQMVQQLESKWEGASAGLMSQLANTVSQLSSKQYWTVCPLKLYTCKGSGGIKTGRNDNESTAKVLLLQKFLFP